jgi:hypothetical protein
VDADPAAAGLDEALEAGLLPRVQNVAGGTQKDDRAVAPQVVVGERGLINNEVEVVERKTKTLQKVKPEDVIAKVKQLLQ